MKKYREQNVLDAARDRVSLIFDDFKYVVVSFSGGKDSTVLFHLLKRLEHRLDRATQQGPVCGHGVHQVGIVFHRGGTEHRRGRRVDEHFE